MCVNPIETYFNAIKGKEPGQADTRYKSWEYCHAAFLEAHKSNKPDYDYLALHLAFYLASWGMYRGSSFLLQRDYKTHIPVVEEIMKSKYDDLWDFDPQGKEESIIESAVSKIFDLNNEIIKLYKSNEKDEATDTLVTKILMGTFACVPAFDRFLKLGIKYLKEKGKIDSKITQTFSKNSCKILMKYQTPNCNDIPSFYPKMKLMDMYLWQIGYNLEEDKDQSYSELITIVQSK